MAIGQPLPLNPIPVPKVWGGDRMRAFLERAPQGNDPEAWTQHVGEVWLLCDREDRTSTVASGAFEGRTLRGLMLSEREALLGDVTPSRGGTFPLLLKLLDVRESLSVQVHPDAAAAHALGSEEKSECWYVLQADEGAEVLLGLADGVDARRFASGATTPDVVDLMQRFAVRTGDAIDVPAGTVHAVGAGLAIVEVQSNSDTTYRIYDWDREVDGARRTLHVEEALRSIDYARVATPPATLCFEALLTDPPADAGADAEGEVTANRRAVLSDGVRFRADVLDIHEAVGLRRPVGPSALVVLSGRGRIDTGDGRPYPLERGRTWLLPADLERARIVDVDGDLRLLRARPTATPRSDGSNGRDALDG